MGVKQSSAPCSDAFAFSLNLSLDPFALSSSKGSSRAGVERFDRAQREQKKEKMFSTARIFY
jgi:hypothetical protein